MNSMDFIATSVSLDRAGLRWEPEIGDEVTEREALDRVAILVDPQGHSPEELRDSFIWLPTVEQLIDQIGVRGGALYHVGLSEGCVYEAVVRTSSGVIEVRSESLRVALGQSLIQLLQTQLKELVH